MRFFLGLLAAVALAAVSTSAPAEEKRPAKAKAPEQTQEQFKIDAGQLLILIKSTIIAVQQANQTGNYSVLRDMGSPIFRERFDQAKLTAIFANLRNRGLSLYPVLFLGPNLSKQPDMTEGHQLHLTGYFATQPLQIQFEMLFLYLDGVWRLDGLSVDGVPAPAPQASADASRFAADPPGLRPGDPKPPASAGNAQNDKTAAKPPSNGGSR